MSARATLRTDVGELFLSVSLSSLSLTPKPNSNPNCECYPCFEYDFEFHLKLKEGQAFLLAPGVGLPSLGEGCPSSTGLGWAWPLGVGTPSFSERGLGLPSERRGWGLPSWVVVVGVWPSFFGWRLGLPLGLAFFLWVRAVVRSGLLRCGCFLSRDWGCVFFSGRGLRFSFSSFSGATTIILMSNALNWCCVSLVECA